MSHATGQRVSRGCPGGRRSSSAISKSCGWVIWKFCSSPATWATVSAEKRSRHSAGVGALEPRLGRVVVGLQQRCRREDLRCRDADVPSDERDQGAVGADRGQVVRHQARHRAAALRRGAHEGGHQLRRAHRARPHRGSAPGRAPRPGWRVRGGVGPAPPRHAGSRPRRRARRAPAGAGAPRRASVPRGRGRRTARRARAAAGRASWRRPSSAARSRRPSGRPGAGRPCCGPFRRAVPIRRRRRPRRSPAGSRGRTCDARCVHSPTTFTRTCLRDG